MDVIYLNHCENPPILPPTVTALGFFDGVHRGHKLLIDAAINDALQLGCVAAVMTFDDEDLLCKPNAPRLTDLNTRLALFASYGIQCAFVVNFEKIRTYSPEQFVRDVLISQCNTRRAICGFNFRFGKGATGTPQMLSSLMEACGASARTMEALTDEDGSVISSSAIRAALSIGNIPRATALLGHPYMITREVVHGKALGRELGLPTINQTFPSNFAVPARGVYISSCDVKGVSYPAVTNIGMRPTVDGTNINCESHLLGFSEWLYGESVCLTLLRRIRDEIKFASIDALKNQIERDICEVKKYYGIH